MKLKTFPPHLQTKSKEQTVDMISIRNGVVLMYFFLVIHYIQQIAYNFLTLYPLEEKTRTAMLLTGLNIEFYLSSQRNIVLKVFILLVRKRMWF